MDNPFIIMSAPNGARRLKSDHPNIPLSPDEMAVCASEIYDAGASILHLHVRDDNGGHSLDVDHYRASIVAVRKTVGQNLIIQATSEAVGIYNRHQQMEMVKELKPEAVSLALRELCPNEDAVTEFSSFNSWLQSERIFPQYILYDTNDYARFLEYQSRGIFHTDKPFILFVFGRYDGKADPQSVDALKSTAQETNLTWAACGFADNEKECVKHAASHQGHIRVGFENMIWNEDDNLLENNAEMVGYCADQAREYKRTVASAGDVRNMFNVRN